MMVNIVKKCCCTGSLSLSELRDISSSLSNMIEQKEKLEKQAPAATNSNPANPSSQQQQQKTETEKKSEEFTAKNNEWDVAIDGKRDGEQRGFDDGDFM